MKIIKTDQGQFIKVDDATLQDGDLWCWGYRWNRNEQAWGKNCLQLGLNGGRWQWIEIDEADLPKRLPEVEV